MNAIGRIERLVEERNELAGTIKAAQLRIEHIDEILSAYKLLVAEDVLPPSDVVLADDEFLASTDSAVKIETAIQQVGKGPFTISDIVSHAGLSRQTARRILDGMASEGKVCLVEKGYRRKPTRYETVQSK